MSNYYPNRDMLWSGFPTNWSLLKRLMWVRIMRGGSVSPVYETVTGNPVTFTAKAAPLRQLSVAFSPVQSGSGDPSPDNVRPITGHSEVNVWVQPTHDTTADPTVSVTIPTPPGTVYGGALDVVSGVLTVTIGIIDLGDVTWDKADNATYGTFFYKGITGKKRGYTNFICSALKPAARGDWGDGDNLISGNNSTSQVYIRMTAYNEYTKAQFKVAVAGIKLCYELAEPITYQLTPQEVQSLLGENNLWSDANGDLTVEYRSN